MYEPNLRELSTQYMRAKQTERNFITAFIHIVSISLMCTALIQLGWFNITGGDCLPRLTSVKYFSILYFNDDETQSTLDLNDDLQPPSQDTDCSTPEVVNLMELVILFNFLGMIFSLFGFFLDIVGPSSNVLKMIRRYGVPGIGTVVFISAIISVCYYISVLLEATLVEKFPGYIVKVEYGSGFYTITAAGVVAALGTGTTFMLAPMPDDDFQDEQLIDSWEDLTTFEPTQPETITNPPPPPYSP